MDEDDVLLVGTDLAGDPSASARRYDDAEGVTAEFNLNLLRVLNRELGADFDLGRLRARRRSTTRGRPGSRCGCAPAATRSVRLAALGIEARFAAGEEMRTEISCKFTRAMTEAMYEEAGLRLAEWHEDPRGWFAVSLARLA